MATDLDAQKCSCAVTLYRNNDGGSRDYKITGKLGCPKCHGYGRTRVCAKCEGAGMLPSSIKCDACLGSGYVPVKTT